MTNQTTTIEAPSVEELGENLTQAKTRRLHEIRQQIKTLAEEEKTLAAQLLDQLPTGKTQVGDLTVTIRQGNARLDTTRFTLGMPATEHPDLYEVKPKALAKIKELIGLNGVQDYVVHGSPVITIKES